jgi:glycolate oxidase
MTPTPDAGWLEQARQITGGQVLTDPADLEKYSHDELATPQYNALPAAVLKPGSEQEVAELVRLCARTGVPVTPRGGGTGLAAACVPAPGGVVLSLERLDRVVEADPDNLAITVQAGLTLNRLNQEAEALGLYFPPHPGDEGACVGGLVATNAGGARAVKYGTIRRFLLGLQVVLASGLVLELGGKRLKNSTGYGLQELMLGSEGTLGIITRVTLALLPKAGSMQTLVVSFADLERALQAVPGLLASGVVPCAVELLEHGVLACAERHLNRRWPATRGRASLMVILDGPDEEDVLRQAERGSAALERAGALEVLLAESPARQREILELRSLLYEALRPATAELFDICLPRSRIAGHVAFVHELEAKHGISLPTYGHAADGNLHTHFLRCALVEGAVGEELPGWRELLPMVRGELYADAAARGGVISGEHGIGQAKKAYLADNLGAAAVEAMRAIKRALDPQGILNPGKIFDA